MGLFGMEANAYVLQIVRITVHMDILGIRILETVSKYAHYLIKFGMEEFVLAYKVINSSIMLVHPKDALKIKSLQMEDVSVDKIM